MRKLPNLHGYMILNKIIIEFQYLQMNQLAYLRRYRTCEAPSCQVSAQPHVIWGSAEASNLLWWKYYLQC